MDAHAEWLEATTQYLDTHIESLYHYTDISGLMGILEEGRLKFWMSDASMLNDVNEGREIDQIFKLVAKDLYNNGDIEKWYYEELLDVATRPKDEFLFQYINKNEKKTILRFSKYSTYILSFTTEADALPMWNYYANGSRYQGYNLELYDKEGLEYLFADQYSKHSGMNAICSKVFYDIELKYKELKELILSAKQFATIVKDSRTALIEIWLYTFRFLFKDKAFAHEREARLIFHLAESVPSEDYMGHGFAIKYRPKNGYIIPYIEIEIPIKCFNSITVGPLIAQQEAKQSLQKFLKSRGYNNVEINCSNVPVRY